MNHNKSSKANGLGDSLAEFRTKIVKSGHGPYRSLFSIGEEAVDKCCGICGNRSYNVSLSQIH